MSRVRSYAFDEDSKLRNAAARIEDVAARYGNVIRMNYDKETAAIENFLTDLKGENIRPLVTKLGVTALVDRLEKNNKAFADFFLRRLSTDQRGKYDVKALRAETDRTLVAVVRRMDSIDDMEPSPEIRALIELYNRLVANRRALLARRASYGEAAVEKRRAEIAEMLRPLLARIVEEKKTAVFAGRTLGTGKNRHYLITFVAENGDEEDRWYRIDGERLVHVPEDELPKPKKKKKPASSTDTPSERNPQAARTPHPSRPSCRIHRKEAAVAAVASKALPAADSDPPVPSCRPQQHRQPSIKDKGAVTKFIFGTAPFRCIRIYITGEQSL
ncbi:DUF6261 family protein [Porphyromonas gingivalis]|uniref:DUF6261 family protein n=1 Tax=Porphyromonas gingivalis TaxID=837 RepID=UPI00040DCB4D|nr:DUF6261 family protein [Porphyromonas gingivalis]